jgi:hypothetical protein
MFLIGASGNAGASEGVNGTVVKKMLKTTGTVARIAAGKKEIGDRRRGWLKAGRLRTPARRQVA